MVSRETTLISCGSISWCVNSRTSGEFYGCDTPVFAGAARSRDRTARTRDSPHSAQEGSLATEGDSLATEEHSLAAEGHSLTAAVATE